MPKEVNIHEAKTHFSQLLYRVMAGEEIIIAKAGVPVARLVPIAAKKGKRKPGSAAGKVWIADDFNSLPDDVFDSFEGK